MDDTLFSGTDENQASTTIEQLMERFDTVDLGDARFLLGMGIQRNIDAGTIVLTQETFAKAVLEKFGMTEARSAKTPVEVGPISIMEEETLCRQRARNTLGLPRVQFYISARVRGQRSPIW